MLFNFVAVVLKIYELDDFIFRVRFARRENCNARHRSDAVESIFVEADDAVERVVAENVALDNFIVAGLANHGGNGNDNRHAPATINGLKQVTDKSKFGQVRGRGVLSL